MVTYSEFHGSSSSFHLHLFTRRKFFLQNKFFFQIIIGFNRIIFANGDNTMKNLLTLSPVLLTVTNLEPITSTTLPTVSNYTQVPSMLPVETAKSYSSFIFWIIYCRKSIIFVSESTHILWDIFVFCLALNCVFLKSVHQGNLEVFCFSEEYRLLCSRKTCSLQLSTRNFNG